MMTFTFRMKMYCSVSKPAKLVKAERSSAGCMVKQERWRGMQAELGCRPQGREKCVCVGIAGSGRVWDWAGGRRAWMGILRVIVKQGNVGRLKQ